MSTPAEAHRDALPPRFDAMPPELRALPRWVTWRGAKVPHDPGTLRSKASVTAPDTWGSFAQARAAYEEGGFLGVGFVLNGDGIVGVDMDKCAADGHPQPAALALMADIGCQYVELSPSGKGLRGFGYGAQIIGRRGVLDGVHVELYAIGRYLTVTGHALQAGPLVSLPGFASTAERLRQPTYRREQREQKSTEDGLSLLPFSSVGSPSFPLTLLPTQAGERNRRIFDLARWFKGAHPGAAAETARHVVQDWHRLALPVIGTKDFATTWADFLHGFERVKLPYGESLAHALDGPDGIAPLPDWIGQLGYGPQTMKLVGICAKLQAHWGEQPFFLSTRKAGRLLDCHYTDAAKMLRALRADGVIEEVSKGKGLEASRYSMKAQPERTETGSPETLT